MECYKIKEAKSEYQEPREVHIPDTKGERVVEGLEICRNYTQPLKTRKVNIGTSEVPKFAFIGDYWDEKQYVRLLIYSMSIKTYFPLSS